MLIDILIYVGFYFLADTVLCVLLATVVNHVSGAFNMVVSYVLTFLVFTNPAYIILFLFKNIYCLAAKQRLPHKPYDNPFVHFIDYTKHLIKKM